MSRKRRVEGPSKPEAGRPETPPRPGASPEGALPAFGFAADILAARRKAAEAPAAKPEPSQPAGRRPAKAAGATTPAALEGPERIFAFADSLAEDTAEETAAAPVVLETWVTLTLHGETYALPVDSVREVLRVSQITRVPHAPRPIRGVTNLRGRVIPVIDLRLRLELPESPLDRSHRIVVVESRGRLIGLLVDAVRQVVHIDLNRVEPAPADVITVQSDYILGVYHQGEALILLLDVDRVLIVKEAGAA